MTSLTRAGDELVDELTGEILDETAMRGDRMEYLQAQHALASEQAKLWEQNRRAYDHAIQQLLAEAGVGAYAGPEHRSRYISGGELHDADVERLHEALQWGILTRETYDQVLEAGVSKLDPAKLSKLLQSGVLTLDQFEYLVTSKPRAGYVRTEPVAQAAPQRKAVPA